MGKAAKRAKEKVFKKRLPEGPECDPAHRKRDTGEPRERAHEASDRHPAVHPSMRATSQRCRRNASERPVSGLASRHRISVSAAHRLPGRTQWHRDARLSLTVAGAAQAWRRTTRTCFPFNRGRESGTPCAAAPCMFFRAESATKRAIIAQSLIAPCRPSPLATNHI